MERGRFYFFLNQSLFFFLFFLPFVITTKNVRKLCSVFRLPCVLLFGGPRGILVMGETLVIIAINSTGEDQL